MREQVRRHRRPMLIRRPGCRSDQRADVRHRVAALLSNSFAISGRFGFKAKFGAWAGWINELYGKVNGPLIDE
jgi:hypothetical protein